MITVFQLLMKNISLTTLYLVLSNLLKQFMVQTHWKKTLILLQMH